MNQQLRDDDDLEKVKKQGADIRSDDIRSDDIRSDDIRSDDIRSASENGHFEVQVVRSIWSFIRTYPICSLMFVLQLFIWLYR